MAPKEQSKPTKKSFWTECPQKLQFFPETACPLGKHSADTRQIDSPGCAWYVNSQQDNYCFWSWIRRVSDEDGFMEPLLQHEIAELLGISTTKIHASYKEALQKIQQFQEFEDLKEFFQSE